MSDEFVLSNPLDPRAQPLIDDLIYEYDSRYGDLFDRDGAKVELNRYPPEAFAPPSGNFILLLRDGETIGGGAFKLYDEHTAELKRVWTRRDLRRQGLARKVIVRLEELALAQGYSRIFLTTGFRQPEAAGLYLNNGYSALFDTNLPHALYRHLPFVKHIDSTCNAADLRKIDWATPVSFAQAS